MSPSVKTIGVSAFDGCSSLKEVVLPPTIESVGDRAFQDCSSLVKCAYPSSFKIQPFPSYECLIEYPVEGAIVENNNVWGPDKTVLYYASYASQGTFNIPNTVQSITDRAFYLCQNLKNIEIPTSVTEIGKYVFMNCYQLISIRIPDSVKELGESAFQGCSQLSSIKFSHSQSKIEKNTCKSCTSLSEIEMSRSATEIGESAFEACDSITKFVVTNSVISINYHAFKDCVSLTQFIIGDSLEFLGQYVFENTKVTSITLPATLKRMNFAFKNCPISYIDFLGDTPPMEILDPFGWRDAITFNIPAFSASSYLKSFGDIELLNVGGIPTRKLDVEDFTYRLVDNPGGFHEAILLDNNNKNLNATEVNIDEVLVYDKEAYEDVTYKVTGIFPRVFYGNEKIKKVTIGDNVKFIGDYAFYSCIDLTTLTIGNSVTEIGEYAFDRCAALTSLVIPNSVTTINKSAFGSCNSLASLSIGSSVTSIGENAFWGCESLISVLIPPSVTYVGSNAFYSCSGLNKSAYPSSIDNPFRYGTVIQYPVEESFVEDGLVWGVDKSAIYFAPLSLVGEFEIPTSVTEIGKAFQFCSGLTSVTIPTSVTEIVDNAFKGCSGLKDIVLPHSVTTIGNGCFEGCTSLQTITYGLGVKSIGNDAFTDLTSLKDVYSLNPVPPSLGYRQGDIPSSATLHVLYPSIEAYWSAGKWGSFKKIEHIVDFEIDDIGYYVIDADNHSVMAFGMSKSLPEALMLQEHPVYDGIEYTLTRISPYAFKDCVELVSVKIPNTVTNIGASAFEGCTALADNEIPNAVTEIGERAFKDCSCLTVVEILSLVTSIGDDVFYGCSGIAEIVIPNTLTQIGDRAFQYCSSLRSVKIGESVLTIPANAFLGCSNLTEVIIPNTVTNIEGGSFAHCSSLQSITYGSGVTAIGADIFTGLSSLKKVFSLNPEPPTITNWGATTTSAALYVPSQALEAYKTAPIWSQFSLIVPIDFEYDGMLYSISDTDKRTVMVVSASASIPETLILPEHPVHDGIEYTLTEIPTSAFVGCGGLTSVTIPNSVTEIGEYAFDRCGSLTSLVIPNSVTTIKKSAFGSCNALASLSIGSSVTSIGVSAFWGCECLTSVIIPPSVKNVGSNAFYNNRGLIKSAYPSSVRNPFGNGTAIQYPEEGAFVEDGFVWGAEKSAIYFAPLELAGDFALPPSVEKIGENAFYGCSGLTSLAIGSSMTMIGNTFNGCDGLKSISITAQTPPELAGQNASIYSNATLNVQGDEAAAKYISASEWSRFSQPNLLVVAESMEGEMMPIVGNPGETRQLSAKLMPENVSLPYIFWRSTNPEVASVDAKGLVNINELPEDYEGDLNCMIIAESLYADGPTLEVLVNPDNWTVGSGDSNGDGAVTVTDAVNTANYAVGNEVRNFFMRGADVNHDNRITLSDASGTIKIVLDQPFEESGMQHAPSLAGIAADGYLALNDFSAAQGECATVGVSLHSGLELVALQADIRVPEGAEILDVTVGAGAQGHSLSTLRIDERTMRVVLFDACGSPLASDGSAVLTITLRVNDLQPGAISVANIFASDTAANEYRLGYTGGMNSAQSGILYPGETVAVGLTLNGQGLEIRNVQGNRVIVCNVQGQILQDFVAADETVTLSMRPGVYIVKVGNMVEKIIVK